jgi:hypothetical protein
MDTQQEATLKDLATLLGKAMGDRDMTPNEAFSHMLIKNPGYVGPSLEEQMVDSWIEWGTGLVGVKVHTSPLLISDAGRLDYEGINAITTGLSIVSDLTTILDDLVNLREGDQIEDLKAIIPRIASLVNILTCQGYQDTRGDQ